MFGRFVTPFERFVQQQIASRVLLLIAAAIALLPAKSELAARYYAVLHTSMTVAVGRFAPDMSIHHWINDGLMALFFFVAGLEIKRELLVGDLSQLRQALLPLFAAVGVRSPLERSLHRWDGSVAFGVMPLFALANAGMTISIDSALAALQNTIASGVFVGLVIGKPLGIWVGALICVRLGFCQLPKNLTWRHVFGLSLQAGIGFTMSLFIGELAFGGDPADTEAAKLAVLAASTVAGLLGLAWLARSVRTTNS